MPDTPTLEMIRERNIWHVREKLTPKYASDSQQASWLGSHTDVEFIPAWDGGNSSYSSGHGAYYKGRRKAEKHEIKRHLKEMEVIEKRLLREEKAERRHEIAELRKKAKQLGFKLVAISER